MSEVTIGYSKKPFKDVGNVAIFEFSNRSKIVIADKSGITFTMPFSKELVKKYEECGEFMIEATIEELTFVMEELQKSGFFDKDKEASK